MRSFFHDTLDLLSHPHAGLDAEDVSTEDKGSNLRGTSGDDALYGGTGDDTLRGLGSNDYLSGGSGDDLVFGGSGNDYIDEDGGGSDTLSGDSGDDEIRVSRRYAGAPSSTDHVSVSGGDGDDTLHVDAYSYAVDDYAMEATVSGGDGDDAITFGLITHASIDAGAGDDQLYLLSGQDITVTLGAGSDTVSFYDFQGDSALVIADFEAGDGGDAIRLRDLLANFIPGWEQNNPFGDGHLQLIQRGADAVLQLDIDGGGDGWKDFVVFSGHQVSDLTAFNLDGFPSDGSEPVGEVISGGDSWDDLYGTTGGDTIDGMGSDDELFGGEGQDLLIGGEGDDALYGQLGRDTLIGGAGNDGIDANGDDKAFGGAGDDYITAQYYFDWSGVAKLYGGSGDDHIGAYVYGEARRAGAEIDAGAGADQITLSGDGLFDVKGGSGDDLITLDGVGDRVKLSLGGGVDTVAFDEFLSDKTRVTITDFQSGDDGDKLDLRAFLAQDLQGWDNSTNPFAAGYLRLLEKADGTTLQFSALGDGVWKDLIVLKGVDAGELTASNLSGYPGDGSVPTGFLINGTSHSDDIRGGVGPDTVIGGKGFDHLTGGGGDDSLIGGDGDDALNGDYGSDVLRGGDGDDYIQDYAGADTAIGGAGADGIEFSHYYNTSSVGVIFASGGGGDDSIYYTSNSAVESLHADGGSGEDQFDITNTATVTLHGGAGDDVMYVHGGSVSIAGGAGDDQITFGGSVHGSVDMRDGADVLNIGYTSVESVLEVRGFGGEDKLGLQDFIDWNYGVSDPFGDGYLRLGQRGDDAVLQARYDGGAWSNLVTLENVDAASISAKQLDGYRHGPIWLLGDDGRDILNADADFNHLDGAGGRDVLNGAAGSDLLVGGAGSDQLSGGAGADVFMYFAVSDSTVGDHDLITDLTSADTINLAGVDANANWWGDQAFVLVDAFSGNAGELTVHYHSGPDLTFIMGDTDGDGQADFQIVAEGDHSDFSNFVL